MLQDKKIGAVLVVGGGIAGIQASLELAEGGFKVYLVENADTIGGETFRLGCLACKPCHTYFPKEKDFIKMDCGRCSLPQTIEDIRCHEAVTLLTNSCILEMSGEKGDFDVSILRSPRFIDETRCTTCGLCEECCPVEIEDPVYGKRKAIYLPHPNPVPLSYIIDQNTCNRCGECERECKIGAIDLNASEETIKIKVGAIILSCGFEGFEPTLKHEYGYKRYPNVLSSIEFERFINPAGPYGGKIQRPSDGKIPKRIAWIQCVGSRDAQVENEYCSSVCCTYAVKGAIIAKEHAPEELEATIFYMDMRIFGKVSEEYHTRARDDYGVEFVPSRIAEVKEVESTKNLILRYEDEEEGVVKEREFDMVVLSVGLTPKEGTKEMAKQLGVELNKYGFCKTSRFAPVTTNRPGVYAVGVFASPKDISETVMQAQAAACEAGGLISEARGSLITPQEYPPEIDVGEQEPRIGVFVCHCGMNIGGVIDVPSVLTHAKTLPNVVHAEDDLYICSKDNQRKIIEAVKEHDLNRVVVASCTPHTYEPLFQETIRKAGLNKYLLEMVNIRDQCSWVHMDQKEKATSKAKDLIRMACAKARMLEPLKEERLKINHQALVIGGGLSGMVSALSLAKQGFKVELVEREAELGGNLRHLYFVLDGGDPQEYLKNLMDEVRGHDLIRVHLSSELKEVSGHVGHFRSIVHSPQSEIQIEHGVIIVATGAKEYEPTEYLYGQDERIITQRELEERLATSHQPPAISSVVMIQCVGSRNEEHPYCSRICCQQAIKNALKIKELSQETRVYILYRDIRTYGFMEEYYKKAREMGVIFIRYDEKNKPDVRLNSSTHQLEVEVFDPILRGRLILNPDLLVLSTAIIPQANNKELAQLLKVPLDEDGFFLEAHMRLRPVDFTKEGIFLCGLAHSPKDLTGSISQASAAASRASTILSKETIELEATISEVIDENCDGCAYCIDPCPFDAITLIEYMYKDSVKKTVEVDTSACKGCGTCQATCPKAGIAIRHFRPDQLKAMVFAAREV